MRIALAPLQRGPVLDTPSERGFFQTHAFRMRSVRVEVVEQRRLRRREDIRRGLDVGAEFGDVGRRRHRSALHHGAELGSQVDRRQVFKFLVERLPVERLANRVGVGFPGGVGAVAPVHDPAA